MVPFFGKNHFLNEFSSDFLLSLLKRKGGEDTDSSLTHTRKKISAYSFVLCFCNKVGVPECNTKLRDTTNLYLMDLNKKVVTIWMIRERSFITIRSYFCMFFFAGCLAAFSFSFSLVLSPLVMAFCRRRSTRLAAVIGGLVLSLGVLFTSFATKFYQLFFSYGTVIGKYLPSLYLLLFSGKSEGALTFDSLICIPRSNCFYSGLCTWYSIRH